MRATGRMRMLGAALGLLGAGCLYMPPPPTSVWPLAEGETQIRLHLTSDLLFVERGETPLATLGFYPSLRYALTCDQEMVFFPWPAFRQWGGLGAGEGLRYHQFSLGKFVPVESFVRRGYARALLGDLGTEYLRYDFRRISGPSADLCWIALEPTPDDPRDDRQGPADRTRDFWGVSLSLRGQMLGEGAADLELCATLGRASSRHGGAVEPSLLALRILEAPRGHVGGMGRAPDEGGPTDAREVEDARRRRHASRWWLPHLRIAGWAGE
ncbi:MAG: hypothetical protein GF330_06240 [Candidatus Eisenbacteria bacterium]|nr:hypothetical protein [Candidatus Eisenbacteria bacterium]